MKKKLSLIFTLAALALLTIAFAWDPPASDCKSCDTDYYYDFITVAFTRPSTMIPNNNSLCSAPTPWRVWKKHHYYFQCANGTHAETVFLDQGYCVADEMNEPGSPGDVCMKPPGGK